MREAARLWNGGAIMANPGSADTVTKLGIAAALIWLGVQWLTTMAAERAGSPAAHNPLSGCGCGCGGDQAKHVLQPLGGGGWG